MITLGERRCSFVSILNLRLIGSTLKTVFILLIKPIEIAEHLFVWILVLRTRTERWLREQVWIHLGPIVRTYHSGSPRSAMGGCNGFLDMLT